MKLIISSKPDNKSATKMLRTSLSGFVELSKYCAKQEISLSSSSQAGKSEKLDRKLKSMDAEYCYFWLVPSIEILKYEKSLNWIR